MPHDIDRRRNLTFSQAEGLAELPRPLALGEMPPKFRVLVWEEIHKSMCDAISPGTFGVPPHFIWHWKGISMSLWLEHFERPTDEFPGAGGFVGKIRAVIVGEPYKSFNEVFDLLTALVRHNECPGGLRRAIAQTLQRNQMAYYLDLNGPPTFFPQSSPEEGEAVRAAIGVLAESGMDGARAHLRKAAEAINQEKFADAVRESIHAVESVAKVIAGDAGKTLTPALNELEKRGLLRHGALKSGFDKLYGYTCDEDGIRHSLEKDAADVDQEEAVFMFGACASFCGYLCRKRTKMSAEN